jgi:hypothetical protein
VRRAKPGNTKRSRASWQTLLADLSLVLFMVTAGALGHARGEAQPAPRGAVPQPASPLSVYRDAAGAPPLAAWLAQQRPDARQQLTIVTRYPAGSEGAVPGKVAELLAASARSGAHPRIVIEPGPGGTSAGLGFDAVPGNVAQVLREQRHPGDFGPAQLRTRPP